MGGGECGAANPASGFQQTLAGLESRLREGIVSVRCGTGRAAAGFLVATGVAVAVNLAATPLYHDGASEYPVWKVLNWFMAVGVVTVLATVFLNRRTQGNREEGCPRCAHVGGVVFYASVVLASLFSGSGSGR